ncbi:hypothetical protein C8A05DRAFT_46875 [Staphylotrichum tortipilum]|uniref:Uncharacterized protein n=1 Tax=Staphylotrichum tortipilum TaxID=2831512 RepID=A0AAN6MDF6_9PEZI|nr:hypothetical protein C8A05DRAFT_46875 [Staphylotrichum longicolle]
MRRVVGARASLLWCGPSSHIGRWLSLWRQLRRLLGLPPTDQSAVLAGLMAALKAESEAALGTPIATVSVSAPWVAAWEEDFPVDSVVNDALAASGLAPWTLEASWPIYMGEVNAVLAANGLQHCRQRWCGVPAESVIWPNITYFISLTNDSLYTSFQPTECFFFSAWANRLTLIDTKYGLDNLGSATTPALFWDALRVFLDTRAADFAKTLSYGYAVTILTAGEAANHPDFLAVVREVARDISQGHRDGKGELRKHRAEVVVSDDPTYAAARGSAFWLRTRIDWSYCKGVDGEDGKDGEGDGETVSQDNSDRGGHTEL